MIENLEFVLTEAFRQIEINPSLSVVDWLARALAAIYDEASIHGTLDSFQATCARHPLSALFLLDPYAKRAFEKPRGYAGDAVMLDYIYRPSGVALSGLAKTMHEATTSLPNAASIVWRRDYLARTIASKMSEHQCPHILSVASGHMRELDTLRTLTSECNVQFTAIDSDRQSLKEAETTYFEYNIDVRAMSFVGLIRGRLEEKSFDLIYSAGLFDYLNDKTGKSLIKSMFDHLNPGGKISIGNFTKDSHGRGFMSGFMDWDLIYRNESDIARIATEACPDGKMRVFRDGPGNVAYVEIEKSA